MRLYLEGVDDRFDVCLDSFVGKLRAGQGTHALQSQVAQVSLSVLQELAQLVTGSHQQVWLTAEQKPTFTSLLVRCVCHQQDTLRLHKTHSNSLRK